MKFWALLDPSSVKKKDMQAHRQGASSSQVAGARAPAKCGVEDGLRGAMSVRRARAVRKEGGEEEDTCRKEGETGAIEWLFFVQ